MKGNLLMINGKVKEIFIGQMVNNIKEIGKMVNRMELEYI